LSPSQPTAAARSPNPRAPARDARASAEEPVAEETLSAHAKRALRTRISAAATAVLDAGIASLQHLRTQCGGAQAADEADEDRPRSRSDRPGGRRDAAAPAEEAQAPAPKRRLRAFLVYVSVLLAGGMGGGALGYDLLSRLLDRQSAESRRMEAAIAKHAKSAAAAQKELEQAQAKRVEAEKKLEVSLGEYAKSSAEVRNKLDAAESRLAPFLAAERARNPRQPVSRGSARGKILPVKTGDCKADPGNLSALKDCINDFYR